MTLDIFKMFVKMRWINFRLSCQEGAGNSRQRVMNFDNIIRGWCGYSGRTLGIVTRIQILYLPVIQRVWGLGRLDLVIM